MRIDELTPQEQLKVYTDGLDEYVAKREQAIKEIIFLTRSPIEGQEDNILDLAEEAYMCLESIRVMKALVKEQKKIVNPVCSCPCNCDTPNKNKLA